MPKTETSNEPTPGPWNVTPAYIYQGERQVQIENEITMIGEVYDTSLPGETDANARLIAAAPEMLEACKDTITYLEKHADTDSSELWGKVSAAYRKAMEPTPPSASS